jgi:hypothetical protein
VKSIRHGPIFAAARASSIRADTVAASG